MAACTARMDALRPASFISGIRRSTARDWSPTTRVSRKFSKLAACMRNAACRQCGAPAGSTKMIDNTSAMSARDLEGPAPKAAVGVRERLIPVADGLVTALAVSLPWSTSATSVLVVIGLLALIPTIDIAAWRREVLSPAGGLPLLLWGLGAIGMLWADVSWSERIAGLSGFHKLLIVPLLLMQFRRSGQAKWAFLGFLVSAVVLLVVSWLLVLAPGL